MSRLLVLLVAVLALFAVSCDAASSRLGAMRAAAAPGVLTPAPAAPAAPFDVTPYAGTYTAYRNSLKVKSIDQQKLQLTWSGLAGLAPNMGDFAAVVTFNGLGEGKAPIYEQCFVSVKLANGQITLSQNLDSMDCGFGMGVRVDGTYVKKQTAVAKKQTSNLAPYVGTWLFARNTLRVKAAGGNKLEVAWSGLAGLAPNMGDFSATLEVVANTAKFNVWDTCWVSFTFGAGYIELSQNGDSISCGFGMGVAVNGIYKKKGAASKLKN